MTQSQFCLQFSEVIDIPEAHMKAFVVCNSSPTQIFYKLKDKILTKFGHENDFDLQVIKQTCWSCEGTGKFKSDWKPIEICWSCGGDGVFRTKKIVLERWLLNGHLFHKPLGELSGNLVVKYDPFEHPRSISFSGVIRNEIQGYIRHDKMEGNPQYCLYYLMWHYDRDMFWRYLTCDVNGYYKKERLKFQRLLRKYNPLAAISQFLQVKKQEVDDLPF